jgi:DNA-binding MarR family transcriptional regulator
VYDIVSRLSITVGGVSKAVDRMEALGYCVRRSNPDDRRSSIIELTPAGESLLAEAIPVVDSELGIRLGAALPARSLQQLSATIASLRTANANINANSNAEGAAT